jgi:hypothetical protein
MDYSIQSIYRDMLGKRTNYFPYQKRSIQAFDFGNGTYSIVITVLDEFCNPVNWRYILYPTSVRFT